jgi:triosephosphate isomerase
MSVKNKVVVANWKMHKAYVEGLILANTVIAGLEKFTGPVEVVLCPSFIHLQPVQSMLKDYLRLHAGAQNCHHF